MSIPRQTVEFFRAIDEGLPACPGCGKKFVPAEYPDGFRTLCPHCNKEVSADMDAREQVRDAAPVLLRQLTESHEMLIRLQAFLWFSGNRSYDDELAPLLDANREAFEQAGGRYGEAEGRAEETVSKEAQR